MSSIAYAMAFRQCGGAPDCLTRLLELQPSHPLTPHMRFRLATSLLWSGRGEEVTDEFVDGLDLPEGLKPYLLQLPVLWALDPYRYRDTEHLVEIFEREILQPLERKLAAVP